MYVNNPMIRMEARKVSATFSPRSDLAFGAGVNPPEGHCDIGLETHLTKYLFAFSTTLTTRALYPRSLWRFQVWPASRLRRAIPISDKVLTAHHLLVFEAAPSRSTKMCSLKRPRPSMLIAIARASPCKRKPKTQKPVAENFCHRLLRFSLVASGERRCARAQDPSIGREGPVLECEEDATISTGFGWTDSVAQCWARCPSHRHRSLWSRGIPRSGSH